MAEGFLNQISVFGRVYDITPVYDTELDENSENAVQNKAIAGEISGLDEKKADRTELDQVSLSLQETQGDLVELNSKVDEKADKATTLEDYGIQDAYTKTEVNGLITTPNVEYVTVTATQETTSATDVLPETGSADTIYRVANWGGSQYDTAVYSEYAWTGSDYILLSLHSVPAGLPIVLQNESTVMIEPNKFNLWETPMESLEVSFTTSVSGYADEYIIDFTCPSDVATQLTLPRGIVWANDDDLEPEAGMRYQVSILNGLGVYAGWEAAAS